jgi:hypothetical protein
MLPMNRKRMLTSPNAESEPLSKKLRDLYHRKSVVDDLIRTLIKYDRASRRTVKNTEE